MSLATGRTTTPRPLLNPGIGTAFTQHMVSATYTPAQGWGALALEPLGALAVHPATSGLHYGQVIFEGLKAHRGTDGAISVFRPLDHARRFRRSAHRMAMPELPEEMFVEAVEALVAADHGSLSDDPGHSLYLRPLMFGADASLMLRPSGQYRFLLMAFVAGGLFGDQLEAVSVWVSREYCRAAPGGTGEVKCAGNYAASLIAQQQAAEAGYHQVVWLDPVERRWVEEMGGMNLFLVRGAAGRTEVVTPAITGTILAGITRDSLLKLAAQLGYRPSEEQISVEQWRAGCAAGSITEAFASGTAAVVTPIGTVGDTHGGFTVGDGTPGAVTLALRKALLDVQRGAAPDPYGWRHLVVAGSDAA
jgi:branched-chain amino acid aminotransferase